LSKNLVPMPRHAVDQELSSGLWRKHWGWV
jgi:hypothetical protein